MRYARCGRPQPVTSSVEAIRSTPLESGLRSKDLRAVRRGAVGKVPDEATRWPLTLPHAGFGGGNEETCQLVERLVSRLVPTLHQIGARRVFAGAMGGALAINAPDVMTALGWTGALF